MMHPLRSSYDRDPHGTFQAGWSLSWWRHGGEPGPDWLSDKVDLTVTGRRAAGIYIRARNAPAPPFQTSADKLTGPVPPALAAQLPPQDDSPERRRKE